MVLALKLTNLQTITSQDQYGCSRLNFGAMPLQIQKSIPFEDFQMILQPFLKISTHIRLGKMPLSSDILGQ